MAIRVKILKEQKKRKDDPCEAGYHMIGMKKGKGGSDVPNCVPLEEATLEEMISQFIEEELAAITMEKKEPCKPSKGKRFAKRVDGKCRSYGQAGKAKDGGDRIRPGTEKAHAYCARSAGIKKCKNPPCANALSRKKWKCKGKRSVPE